MQTLHFRLEYGIEAACAVGNLVVVAGETVVVDGDVRAAPVGIYNVRSGRWLGIRLQLTSDTGKVAALACRARGEAIEFLAIERHFNVRRILRWVSPIEQFSAIQTPQLLLDLSADSSDNIEGIEWTEDGTLALIVDNYFRGRRSGAGKLLLVTPTSADVAE